MSASDAQPEIETVAGPAYAGPRRVFSGIQPTGNLHLGNYLGAAKRFIALQERFEALYCVVDMHAITVWQEPAQLARNTRELTAAYLASGLDAERAIIFNQSAVPGHAELAWIFNCVARMGWMSRMTQFKDKSGKHRERASLGLFAYPALMAADILLYRATDVPVGEDQKQHVELARDIAQKFMVDYEVPGFFPLPEPLIEGPATRIMSLRDGAKKMSKSDPSEMSRVHLMDDADTIAQKIRKARTDPEPVPASEAEFEGRPEAANLVRIFAALAGSDVPNVLLHQGGRSFSEFKNELTELAVAELSPIRERMISLLSDPAELDGVLARGAERARALAAPILTDIKETVGFLNP